MKLIASFIYEGWLNNGASGVTKFWMHIGCLFLLDVKGVF